MSIDKIAKAYYKVRGVFPGVKISLAYNSGKMRLDSEWSDKFCFDIAEITFFNAFPIDSDYGYIHIHSDGSIIFTGPYEDGYYVTRTEGGGR